MRRLVYRPDRTLSTRCDSVAASTRPGRIPTRFAHGAPASRLAPRPPHPSSAFSPCVVGRCVDSPRSHPHSLRSRGPCFPARAAASTSVQRILAVRRRPLRRLAPVASPLASLAGPLLPGSPPLQSPHGESARACPGLPRRRTAPNRVGRRGFPLMERAGAAAANVARTMASERGGRVLVLAGPGQQRW